MRGIRLFILLTLLLPAILAGQPILLDGQVVTAGGEGIAGAWIEVHAPLPHSPEGRLVARAVTGADGRFELPAPGPGLWSLTIRADGFPPMRRPAFPLFADTGLLPVELPPAGGEHGPLASPGADGWEPALNRPSASPSTQPPALSLTGQVIEQKTRRPLPRALVWLADDPGGAVWTNQEGRFRVSGTARHSPVELRAAALDFVPTSLSVSGTAPLVLALAPAPALAGTVVDGGGKPLSGAEVRLTRRDEVDAWAARADAHRARTSAQGTFRLSGLTAGASYDLLASLPGHAPATAPVSMPQQGQSRTGLVLRLHRGRAAAGLLVNERGRPVAGARVELVRSRTGRITTGGLPLDEDGLYRATSGADGRFTLPHLPAGWFDLRIEGDGLAPLERAGLKIPEGNGTFDLGRFLVERGVTLAGRVTDPRGRPVPGAEIWLVPRSPRDWISFYKKGPAAKSGAKGEFVIPDLSPRAEVSLDVCRKEFLPTSIPIRELPADNVEAVLDPAVRLAGRVRAPDGSPVSGARVLAWRSGESREKPQSLRPCRLRDATAETDRAGQFALESLAPGWWTVRAEAPGWLSAESPRREVLAGQALEGIEIVLAEGAVVTGRVFSPEGAPLPGAEVRAFGELGNPRAVSAGDGSYRLTGVEIGQRNVEATHPDHEFASRTLAVSPGTNQLDLKLRPSNRSEIRGRVVDPDGRLVAGARVTTGQSASYTAEDGTFSLLEGNGTYEVWADKEGYAPRRAAQPVVVAGRPVERVEIRLIRGGVVTGRLLGLTQEALQGARVELNFRKLFQTAATVDPQGVYRLADVPPGQWTITATAGERTVDERVSVSSGGEEVVVDLQFPETWEVTGRVVGPYGEPMADALLRFATGQRGPSGWTYSRGDGTFRLELEDGTYRVWVMRRSSFQSALEDPVVVEGGPVSGIELRLGEEIVLRGLVLGLEPGERAKTVWVEGPHGQTRQGELDQQSGFVVHGLSPGEWKVTVTHEGREVVARVEIEEGETEVAVEVEFAPSPPPEADTPEG